MPLQSPKSQIADLAVAIWCKLEGVPYLLSLRCADDTDDPPIAAIHD